MISSNPVYNESKLMRRPPRDFYETYIGFVASGPGQVESAFGRHRQLRHLGIHPVASHARLKGTSPVIVVSRRNVLAAALGISLLSPVALHGEDLPEQARDTALKKAYDEYADQYDLLDGRESGLARALGFPGLRRETISRAFGRVLEVGCGTGANLPLYAQTARSVISLTGLDISSGMLARARKVGDDSVLTNPKTGQRIHLELVQADVASLPFEDESFDTVVDTFSLCVFEDPVLALREMRRVLKRSAEARMLLLEHSASSFRPLSWYQNVTAPAVASSSKGCFWNQNVVKLVSMAGLKVISQNEYLAGTTRLLELRRSDIS